MEVHVDLPTMGVLPTEVGPQISWCHREIRKIILETLSAVYQILTSIYHVIVC